MDKVLFIHPNLLYLLLSLPILATLLYLFEQSRSRRLKQLAVSSERPGERWKRIIAPTLLTLPLVLAAARPYQGMEEIKSEGTGRDIMLVVDVSRSMLAADTSPSRLEAAKRKILDLLDLLKKEAPSDRLGIVLFSGEAYLFCPLTADHGILRHFTKAIDADLIMSQGSSLERAVEISLKSLVEVKAKLPRILMLTDGEDLSLDRERLERRLSSSDVPFDIIGFGTLEGRPIELESGALLKNRKGEIVITKLNEDALRKLASASQGTYLRNDPADRDLTTLISQYIKNDGVTRGDDGKTVQVYDELGYLLVWFAGGMLLIFVCLGKANLVFALILFLQVYPREALAEEVGHTTLNQAFKAYEQGHFEEALNKFEKERSENPSNLDVLQALGSSYFKLGRFSEAENAFAELRNKALSGRQKFEAQYNLGNSLFMQKKLKESIKEYDDALLLKPDDQDTKYNRDLALKQLEQQKQQEQQKSEDQQQDRQQKEEQEKKQDQQTQENSDQHRGKEQEQQESSGENSQQENQQQKENGSGEQQDSKESEKKDGDSNSHEEKQEKEGTVGEKDAEQAESSRDLSPSEQAAAKKEEEKALPQSEAQSWLESLSDAPVLYYRKQRELPQQSEQTW